MDFTKHEAAKKRKTKVTGKATEVAIEAYEGLSIYQVSNPNASNTTLTLSLFENPLGRWTFLPDGLRCWGGCWIDSEGTTRPRLAGGLVDNP